MLYLTAPNKTKTWRRVSFACQHTLPSADVCAPAPLCNMCAYNIFVDFIYYHIFLRNAAGCWFTTRAASTLPALLDDRNEQLPHRTILNSRHQEERWTVADLEVIMSSLKIHICGSTPSSKTSQPFRTTSSSRASITSRHTTTVCSHHSQPKLHNVSHTRVCFATILQRHSTALAHGLYELEVGPGDTILAWMSNQAEHVCWRLIVVNLF